MTYALPNKLIYAEAPPKFPAHKHLRQQALGTQWNKEIVLQASSVRPPTVFEQLVPDENLTEQRFGVLHPSKVHANQNVNNSFT